jgi:hypothetical protein
MELIMQERRKVSPTYNPINGGQIRDHSLKHLEELLKLHSLEEIKAVVLWGIHKPFWCTRIGTPSKLRKNFDEALFEMKASEHKAHSKEHSAQKNREYALKLSKNLKNHPGSLVSLELLNKYVEVTDGSHFTTCIDYEEKGFVEQLENALKKRGVTLSCLEK